jgi:hypothetical protein
VASFCLLEVKLYMKRDIFSERTTSTCVNSWVELHANIALCKTHMWYETNWIFISIIIDNIKEVFCIDDTSCYIWHQKEIITFLFISLDWNMLTMKSSKSQWHKSSALDVGIFHLWWNNMDRWSAKILTFDLYV